MNVHTLLFMNTTGKTVHSISNIKLTTITTKDSKASIQSIHKVRNSPSNSM